MGHIHVSQHIGAPVERAFGIATDVERIPEYNPYMEIRDLSGPIDLVGTTFKSTLKILGRHTDATGTIVDVEPNRLIHIKGIGSGGESSDWAYRFVPEGSASRVTLDVDYEMPGGIMGDAMDRLIFERAFERAMRHMAENFTALVEARVLQHA